MGLKYFHSRQEEPSLFTLKWYYCQAKSKQRGKHVICTQQVCKG